MSELLHRRLARAERRVEILERVVDDQANDLYMVHQDLLQAAADLATTQHLMPGALVIVDRNATIIRANRTTEELLGYEPFELNGTLATEIWPRFDAASLPARREVEWRARDGAMIPVLLSSAAQEEGAWARLVCVAVDLRERQRDEISRRHAQKLESLGQLAAGVAHEINTPMQFISDNLHLLERGATGMLKLSRVLHELATTVRRAGLYPELVAAIEEAERESRWEYFEPRLERALERAQQGVKRVSDITIALKRFSHPRNDLDAIDLNEALVTTLTVARTELRAVAAVHTVLGALPPVRGHAGDLNQVFLNLIVNAIHAIEDAGRQGDGTIEIRTRSAEDDTVEIAIADNGCGIPPGIQSRIFDPFFTTKEPGRGRGQGLSLAHAVVVERHGGALQFETSPAGTTFFVRLPVQGPPDRTSP